MKLVAYTTKVEERQAKQLKALSNKTQVPQSAYIRRAIDLIIEQAKNDVVSLELERHMDEIVSKDKKLLRRLSKT